MERWQTRWCGEALRITSALWSLTWGVVINELGREVVVEDTGAADTAFSFTHGLGRVPRGLLIVNQEVPSGTDPVAWYRVTGDDAWGERDLTVRWTVSNARVLVRVW